LKPLSTLRDLGRGRTCLIIGGGHSVNKIDFDKIPKDVYIISTNNHKYKMADMIVYYDKDMNEYFRNKILKPNQLLVGFQHSKKLNHTTDNCTHFYTYQDMIFGDTGYHCLQFADKIFRFDKIYLTGFDYTVSGDSYHYDEDVSDKKKLKTFKKWSIGKVLLRYNDVTWTNEIYNCNKVARKTDFDYFGYDLPY